MNGTFQESIRDDSTLVPCIRTRFYVTWPSRSPTPKKFLLLASQWNTSEAPLESPFRQLRPPSSSNFRVKTKLIRDWSNNASFLCIQLGVQLCRTIYEWTSVRPTMWSMARSRVRTLLSQSYREERRTDGRKAIFRECSVITDIFYVSLFKIGFSLRFDASLANDKQRFRF